MKTGRKPTKLHAAHAAKQLRNSLVSSLVLRLERDKVIGRLELDVLRLHESVRLAQRLGLRGRQRLLEILHGLQEHELLVARPGRHVRVGGLEVLALPLLGEFVADVDERGVELGLGRQAGAVEPLLPVDRGQFVSQAGVLRLAEELEVGGLEVVLVQGFPGPFGEVEGDELVKGFPADQPFEVPDEVEALLVGNSGEGVIRVDGLSALAPVADVELCKLVVCAE